MDDVPVKKKVAFPKIHRLSDKNIRVCLSNESRQMVPSSHCFPMTKSFSTTKLCSHQNFMPFKLEKTVQLVVFHVFSQQNLVFPCVFPRFSPGFRLSPIARQRLDGPALQLAAPELGSGAEATWGFPRAGWPIKIRPNPIVR